MLFTLGWVAKIQAFIAISARNRPRACEEAEVAALVDAGLRSELEVTASPIRCSGFGPRLPQMFFGPAGPCLPRNPAASCRQAMV